MRRSWIGRALDGGPERLEERLAAATAQADWTAVYPLVRRLLRHRPDDLHLLNLGARAVIHAAHPPRGAVATAIDWLQHAHALAPGDVETLHQLGILALARHAPEAAEDYWRRAATADPDHPAVGEALRDLWVGRGSLPTWALPLAEARLLAADDAALQALVLAAWEAGAEVSADGYRLLRRWFFERGERAASLVSVLSDQLLRLERLEEASREVFALRAEDDPAAARGLVRCDARRRRFDPAAATHYRAAAGEPEADLLLAVGLLDGQLGWDAVTAGAVARALELTEAKAFGLERRRMVLALADYHLQAGNSPEGVAAVAQARELQPDNPRLLRYLADAWRPRTDPAALAVYQALFRAQATDEANVAFLAEGYLAGQFDLPEPRPLLVAYLGRRPAELALLLPAATAWAERGAAAADLVGLAQRLLPPQRAELFDALAARRFHAGDYALAAELTAELVAVQPTATARYKLAVCRARAGLEVTPDSSPRIAAVATCLAVLRGQPVGDAELVTALEQIPATPGLRAARRALAHQPIGDLLPLDPGDAALLATARLAAGDPQATAALDGSHPDSALLEAWLALRQQPQVELAWRLLDQPAPWTAAEPFLLDLLARGGDPAQLRALRPRLSRQQRLFVELRRVATAIDQERLEADELERLAPALEPGLAAALRLVAAEQTAAAALRRGEAAEAAELLAATPSPRARWLEVLAAWQQGDEAAATARLAALPEELLADPAAAWEIALRQPAVAEAALARALRLHRQREDLRLGLAAVNARIGRLDRFLGWATPLLDGPHGARLEAVRRLLAEGLEALPPDPAAPEELALAAALAQLQRGAGAAAQAWLMERTTPEAVNLRALGLLREGQLEPARALLASLPDSPAAWHNRAVAAALAGGPAAAVAAREAELAASATPTAWQHKLLAAAYHELGRAAEELAQWEAALALRPADQEARRARLDPLLRLGRAAEAREASEALLAERPETDLKLDHAAVLAASDGAAAAVAWLEQLAGEQPELREAALGRRAELHARLTAQVAERAAAGDDLGAFRTAREAERMAVEPDDVARAKLHQAVALGRLAEGSEAAARLEQALARSREVAASAAATPLRQQAERLAGQVAARLARALVRQAAELLDRRAGQWQALQQRAPHRPRHGGRLARGLAGAFGRVLALLAQADELLPGTSPAALRAEAERLAAAAEALAKSWGEEA